jgi:hypothetical protein
VLATLLRGRRGTEVYVSLHEPGEMFVMLDDSAAIGRRLLPLDRIGKTLHLAAAARGGEAGNSKPEVIVLAGNDLKPYAPAHLAASGSFGADITLTWVRRTRVGGELKDGFGTVLLAEDTEEYELEVLGPDDDVRRTITGLSSPTFTYTAAMQAEDFPEGVSCVSRRRLPDQRPGRPGLCRPLRLPQRDGQLELRRHLGRCAGRPVRVRRRLAVVGRRRLRQLADVEKRA